MTGGLFWDSAVPPHSEAWRKVKSGKREKQWVFQIATNAMPKIKHESKEGVVPGKASKTNPIKLK